VITQEAFVQFLTRHAYQPEFVYGAVLLSLTASSFGFHLPEEVTLVSAGLVAHIAAHPELYPPPEPGLVGVHPVGIAIFCLLVVVATDFLVFSMGRLGRQKADRLLFFQKFFQKKSFLRVSELVKARGLWMAFVFRFTPGVRFPGHLACGFLGISRVKFLMVDSLAAVLTVPTQVLLLAYYGEIILSSFNRFKILILVAFATGAVSYLIYRYRSAKILAGDIN
jgi:membrane protein DedA with SNARE-associated domain